MQSGTIAVKDNYKQCSQGQSQSKTIINNAVMDNDK